MEHVGLRVTEAWPPRISGLAALVSVQLRAS